MLEKIERKVGIYLFFISILQMLLIYKTYDWWWAC